VIFLGLAVAGREEEMRLIKGLQKKFSISPERAESLLQRVPIVVKKGVSKEEIEKYVRAIEEIGGRARVEAEPVTEALGVSPEPMREHRPEREPWAGPTITCPKCGFEQPETNECAQCGVVISQYVPYQEMARSYGEKGREISSEEKPVPWENGEGFIRAFFRTTWEGLFSPTRFFKKVAKGEGYWSPLIYGVMIGIIGRFSDLFWAWLLIIPLIPPSVRNFMALPQALFVTVIVFAMPFIVAISMLVWSCVIHFTLMIIGGNKKNFQTTFRAISYSYSARLFHIVPFIGSSIGNIYRIALFILGIREGHGITTGRAAVSVLLPLIVAIAIFIAILLPVFIRLMDLFGGVRI
jgi:hypothetical protein